MKSNTVHISEAFDYSQNIYSPTVFERIKLIISDPQLFQAKNEDEELLWLQEKVDIFNSDPGGLTGFDCHICNNKGIISSIVEGREVLRECSCVNIRNSLARIEKSGLKELLDDYSFDNYFSSDLWQVRTKDKALEFADSDGYGKWFYIGGQVGCGKTHICTAIVSRFLNKGKLARYMLWRDEIVNLKAKVTNDSEYFNTINPLKTVEVLYIDDFLKTKHGELPTAADLNVAFEILNYRYNNKSLITILSGERSIDSLIKIDEALGSRIYQRTKDYCINIESDSSKNYRLPKKR